MCVEDNEEATRSFPSSRGKTPPTVAHVGGQEFFQGQPVQQEHMWVVRSSFRGNQSNRSTCGWSGVLLGVTNSCSSIFGWSGVLSGVINSYSSTFGWSGVLSGATSSYSSTCVWSGVLSGAISSYSSTCVWTVVLSGATSSYSSTCGC
jgi:hypothetical protein